MKKALVTLALLVGGAAAFCVVGSQLGYVSFHSPQKKPTAEEAITQAAAVFVVQKTGAVYRFKTMLWSDGTFDQQLRDQMPPLNLQQRKLISPEKNLDVLVVRMPQPPGFGAPYQYELPFGDDGRCGMFNLTLDEVTALIKRTKKANQALEPTRPFGPSGSS